MAKKVFRILLIDNDINNLMTLESCLSSPHREILHSHSPDEALLIMKQTEVHLVITDSVMPHMDGFELIEYMESQPKLRRIHTIIILRNSDHLTDDIVRGLNTNAVDYLIKPVHPEVTKAKVLVFERLFYKALHLKEKNESIRELLNNILPRATVDELRISGKARPRSFEMATVLFTDFVSFTKKSANLPPNLLVKVLDYYFAAFDRILDQYPIEKIKTIGDAYMAAGGIPLRNTSNPIDVVLCALEIRDFMETNRLTSLVEGGVAWDIRIGIHTGPLVAGVVGQKKWAYDIWGDTVNTANRIESAGLPSQINISQDVYNHIEPFFDCEHRGKVVAKHKGEIDMYFVQSIKEKYSIDGAGVRPNEKFKLYLSELSTTNS